MVWKSVGYGGSDYQREEVVRHPVVIPQQRNPAPITAYVGKSTPNEKHRNSGCIESVPSIDDDILCYNAEPGFVLVRLKENDRKFDKYVRLPFTKGVTERETGRTLLILGDLAHHGEAMQGQFDVAADPYAPGIKKFGNTLRWINVGGINEGFIGLDYRGQAESHEGVAISDEDVAFLANTLLQYGFDPHKRLYLLQPPYIKESDKGKQLRAGGLETLLDWSKS